MIYQYIKVAISSSSLNIFSQNQSAGDQISGTLIGFSTPISITFFLISFCFIRKFITERKTKDAIWSTLTMTLGFLPGAASIFFCLFGAIGIITLFYVAKNLKKKQTYVFIAVLPVIIAGVFIQGKNVDYGVRLLSKFDDNNIPIKALMYYRIFNIAIPSGDITPLGVGGGNFSSRAALTVSGEYLLKQPSFIPVTPSYYTQKYITDIYSKNNYGTFVNGFDGGSMVNEPFSEYITIFTEGGLISLILFLAVFFFIIMFSIRKNDPILLLMIFFSFLVLFTNNWVEYIEFSSSFFLVLSYLIRCETNA
ncbi:hypothetical protein [Thalassospira sp.]|uniref:hypothetical protein n=1 Tax=Thalassospira sp. TaxID=1912094 RepID=UPI003AA8C794